MGRTIALLLFATTVLGYKPGLRVKYGAGTQRFADKLYFFDMPRTIHKAKDLGWQETVRPPGPLSDLKMYCPSGKNVCPLYHPTEGYVAGIQIALPEEQFKYAVISPEKNFVKWTVSPDTEGDPKRTFWTITQYYVPEESLNSKSTDDKSREEKSIQEKSTEKDTEDNGPLKYGAVWVKGFDGKLMMISTKEAEISAQNFTKQNCIPNMGTHYYYKLSPKMDCNELFPWFPITKEGKMIGVGFIMYGQLEESHNQTLTQRNWFENFSDPRITSTALGKLPFMAALRAVFPSGPSCLLDNYATFGCILMHTYFIDDPWNIKCSLSDSVDPVAGMFYSLL